MARNMSIHSLSSSSTSTFWTHVISEIAGAVALEELGKVGFVDNNGNIVDYLSKSSINVTIDPPNYLHINGTYTPSKSYTLSYIYLIGNKGDTYIIFDIDDRTVNPGDSITFYLDYRLSITILQTAGFLSKFTFDLTSSMYRLVSLILYVFGYGRQYVCLLYTSPSPRD